MPNLLKTKKYADFRQSYAVGFVELVSAMNPIIQDGYVSLATTQADSELSNLVSTAQCRTIPLSQVIAEALQVARKSGNSKLEGFCKGEIVGWSLKDSHIGLNHELSYRLIDAYVTAIRLNLQYIGWSQNPDAAFEYMRSKPELFVPRKFLLPHSISSFESSLMPPDMSWGILVFDVPWSAFTDDPEEPDCSLTGYASASSIVRVYESIRNELTMLLLDMLPPIEMNSSP